MIGYVGESGAELQRLYEAFRTGSECDPYLGPAQINCASHGHGYGYAIASDAGLHHYRTRTAVFHDDSPLPKVSGRIYAVLHSRLATDASLSGHAFSHPFVAATEKETIFFAHNGGVAPDHLPERMVDSEWALQQVVEAGSLVAALPLLKRKTKGNSALNLLVLRIPRSEGAEPVLEYVNFYDTEHPGKQAYYRMFSGDMPTGRAVFSSTFKDLGIKGLQSVKEAPFGEPCRL